MVIDNKVKNIVLHDAYTNILVLHNNTGETQEFNWFK
jgi:hypothetical protein